jgi:penicillin-binding protein 1C
MAVIPGPISTGEAPFPQPQRRPLRRLVVVGGAALLGTGLLLALLDRLFPPPLARLQPPPATAVLAAGGEPLRFFLPPDERWRLPVRLGELPEELVRAVVASEDHRFFHHPGVDPLAIVRAALSNLRAGRVVSGGSTIPMQLARLIEPGPRTLPSKAREALRALQLERRFSKRRLLELYLNLAPYGGNLEGVGAASYFYFGKRPAQLSLGEIALLVALPRSPTAFDPTRHPEAAQAARDGVLDRLAEHGIFPREEVAAARVQPLPAARFGVPFEAPHFARWAAARAPGRARIPTTVDLRLQRVAEQVVAGRAGELRARGITNAAAVVIENRPRALRALVGSLDFSDALHDGQVDGTNARRSPGSALKPFLYALAYDRGLIVPDSYLLDVPTDFAGYVAENYDGTYRGRVTARFALVTSLNAPAVRLLSAVGLGDFLALLRRGGLATLDRPPGQYGLPLVLGGGEVTLLDLTNLYATLAEGGLARPLRFLADPADTGGAAGDEGERLFSAGAAALVARTLTGLQRPDLPAGGELARGVPAVAWKTGTSFGHRDAWALGFSRRWAVGVWVGNFDGRPVTGISGSADAGPLLFDLFRALGDDAPAAVAAPAVTDTLEVCADSRELPGPWCPRRLRVAYLPGHTRLPPCSVHRRIFVDAETGDLLTGRCLAGRPHRPRVLAVEPPELVAWWRAQGQAVEPLPALAAACGGVPGGAPPRIVSPDGATPYRLRREAPVRFQQIPLLARAGPHSRTLYWYEDGVLVASGPPGGRLFLPPRAGSHRLVLVDDTGRSDSVLFRVEGGGGAAPSPP